MDSMTLEVLKNPDDWISRKELQIFVKLEGSNKKFDDYIKEILILEDNYLYMYGTTQNNMKYHKIRCADYIVAKELYKMSRKRKGA